VHPAGSELWNGSWDEFVPRIIPRECVRRCSNGDAERYIQIKNGAPGRIRTCAPASGGRLTSCSPTPSSVLTGLSVGGLRLWWPPVCCGSFHATFHDSCPHRTCSRMSVVSSRGRRRPARTPARPPRRTTSSYRSVDGQPRACRALLALAGEAQRGQHARRRLVEAVLRRGRREDDVAILAAELERDVR
jgi:hypothetical protein